MENLNYLEKCELCPRRCKVNRINGEKGYCLATGALIKQARIGLHHFEEPCISGDSGSGTIFFSGCNLRCKFCQNYKISQEGKGEEISIQALAEKMICLQEEGANNINLVTGFMYIPQIIESLKIAKNNGLAIPIVYNTSGYESVKSLELLEGFVDIYLPDFKYYYDDLGSSLSRVNNYCKTALSAIKEMLRQQPKNVYDENGILRKGVIIRHLVLPNHIQNSKQILKLIKNNFGKDVYISIMAQYFPCYKALETKDINRKLTEDEFEDIEKFVYKLGLENGYIQYLEDNEEKYVPEF